MFVFAHKHVKKIKNVLNVRGKGNNKNYQINNYDLGRGIFVCICQKTRKANKYVETKTSLQAGVCVCEYIHIFKEINGYIAL